MSVETKMARIDTALVYIKEKLDDHCKNEQALIAKVAENQTDLKWVKRIAYTLSGASLTGFLGILAHTIRTALQ
jgi:hypothetical protein